MSARKLRHGGVIFEVDSIDTKAWISCQSNSKAFSENFGNETIIKDRTFQVIAEYVPTTFNLDSSTSLAETEKSNKLRPGSLIKVKWIKPLARRNPNQRTAFCTLSCKDRESANIAIRLGLTIEGRKTTVHKLLPEPTHCLKCQQLTSDHMAGTCRQTNDTCGTCGLDHRTSECDFGAADPQHHYCVNCSMQGHTAWSRDCPTFKERSNKMHGKSEEARYKYFPTESDPDSWETLGEGNPNSTQPPAFNRWHQNATHEAEYGRARIQSHNQDWTRVKRNKGKSRSQLQTRTRDQGWPNQRGPTQFSQQERARQARITDLFPTQTNTGIAGPSRTKQQPPPPIRRNQDPTNTTYATPTNTNTTEQRINPRKFLT